MSGRRTVGPNAGVQSPGGRESQAEWLSETDEAIAEAERTLNRSEAAALDETMTMREADARREQPRLRTDSANPRMTVTLPPADEVRPRVTSRRQKSLNKTKTEQLQKLPRNQRMELGRATRSIVSSPDDMEALNQVVRGVHGTRSEIDDPRVRQRIDRLDRAIQSYERGNPREHRVYSTMRAPKPHGASLNAMMRSLRGSSENGRTLTFDGYIPSSHDPAAVEADQHSVVLEIKTRSGQYLGGSDSRPEADHLVGRGRVMRVVSVQENVPYEKPDGTRGVHPRVIQLEDVTDDGRTTAR